jgi:hypothetical protein
VKLKRQSHHRRAAIAAVLLLLTMSALTTMQAQQATAETVTSCVAERQKQVVDNAPDKHRVRAMCKQLTALTEVRGYLDMYGCCDKETSWFRDTYVWHYSSWAQGFYSNHGWTSRNF